MAKIHTGLDLALDAVGGEAALARLLGLTRQAVNKWRRVPADRIADVERVSGVPRENLRPDIFVKPDRAPLRLSA